MNKPVYKSVPGAVLGIVGAVFAIIGGLNLAICADIAAGITGGAVDYTWAAWVFGIGSAVIGMVGAIMDFKNNLIAAVLMAVGVAFAIVASIMLYWSWAMILAIVLFAIGLIVSFVVKVEID